MKPEESPLLRAAKRLPPNGKGDVYLAVAVGVILGLFLAACYLWR